MDFTPVIAQVWGMLAWFIPAVFLIALLKSPWAKGHIGELLVHIFAHRQLDEPTYRRLHNVTLNTPGYTTQIDQVFLSICGIFAQEAKNRAAGSSAARSSRSGRRSSTTARSNSRASYARTTITSKLWKPPLALIPNTCTQSSPLLAAAA